jgi:hypothetical protein
MMINPEIIIPRTPNAPSVSAAPGGVVCVPGVSAPGVVLWTRISGTSSVIREAGMGIVHPKQALSGNNASSCPVFP